MDCVTYLLNFTFIKVGDFVDAQDSARKWYEGIVREVTPDTVKVHYFGWGSKWDTFLPRRKGATNSKVRILGSNAQEIIVLHTQFILHTHPF